MTDKDYRAALWPEDGLPMDVGKAERFLSSLRHCDVLGMTLFEEREDGVTLALPWKSELVGNPETGALHGGVLTTLMDTACGTAVVQTLPGCEVCPTLDLRVDYMRSARAGRELRAIARINRISHQVVFAECRVEQVGDDLSSDDRLVARCIATFMRMGAQLDERFLNNVSKVEEASRGE